MASQRERHEHRGTRAIVQLVEYAPSTGGLALWVHHADLPEDEAKGRVIVTDGSTIFYAPSFEALPLPLQVGWVAHEVLHVALRHAQRFVELQRVHGDVDLALFNTCADAIINSALGHLTWLSLPPNSVTLDQLLKRVLGIDQTVEKSLLEWDVERLYRAIDDRRRGPRGDDGTTPKPQPGGKGGQGQGRDDGPKAAQVRALASAQLADLQPGTDAASHPEHAAELARDWSERLVRAHAGDGAFSMLRTLLADLPKSRTPWEQVLRTSLARALSPSPALSWSRPSRSYLANQGRAGPNRRMPYEPGRSATRAVPRLVLVVDVSGSIQGALLERFGGEVKAISRRLEAGVTVVVGDDCVQHVEQFGPGEADLSSIVFKGGGGTDFTPLLEEAGRHSPDVCVVLTDLDGPARLRPSWPVLWVVDEAHAHAVQPFGRLLVLRG